MTALAEPEGLVPLLDQIGEDGCPLYISVDGEAVLTTEYVADCKRLIGTPTGRKNADGHEVFDYKPNKVAEIVPVTDEIKGPDDAPIFIGLPFFNPKTSPEVLERKESDPFVLRLICRDLLGPKATGCAVYLRVPRESEAATN